MRKLLVTNLLVLAGLLALAEVMAALVAQRQWGTAGRGPTGTALEALDSVHNA